METINLSAEIFLLLFCVGLVAGLIDSMAGGGGLIALPVLLFIGLPPQAALGTNKLGGSFGTLSASYNFIKKGRISFREALPGILFTFLGACAGAVTVQLLDPAFIEPLIPVLLLVVFFYTLLTKQLGLTDQQARMNSKLFYALFGLGLGFYDGFFGPGTGSFWTFGLMFLLGFNMIKATAYTKVMNFTSNFVALLWFMAGNNVCYSIGLTMAAGQVIGARIGSSLAIRKGAAIIRPLYLTIVLLTIGRLLYANISSG